MNQYPKNNTHVRARYTCSQLVKFKPVEEKN